LTILRARNTKQMTLNTPTETTVIPTDLKKDPTTKLNGSNFFEKDLVSKIEVAIPF